MHELGVETATALSLLALMGCHAAQGYFIGRPMPLADLFEFLKRKNEQIIPAGSLTAADNLHSTARSA
jgi:sensor c-di-GMP phosphodiesterase-like protein